MDDLLDTKSTNNNNNNYIPGVLPNATTTLVLGIIAIVGCFMYAIPGLVCGIIAIMLHKKDKAIYLTDPERYENSYKTAKAGQVCGIVGLSLSAAFLLFLVIYFVFIISIFSSIGHIR